EFHRAERRWIELVQALVVGDDDRRFGRGTVGRIHDFDPELATLAYRLLRDRERRQNQHATSLGLGDLLRPFELHRALAEPAPGEQRGPAGAQSPVHEVALERKQLAVELNTCGRDAPGA